MERADRAGLAGLFSPEPLAAGATLELDEDAAHHLRVRRVEVEAAVRLTDGRGALAGARLLRLAKRAATVEVGEVQRVPAPPPLHLVVPVADRERMLLLAEKGVELGLATWQPVVWRRSLSVSPRGEGEAFRGKVRARMISALLQSGGAWLPELHAERALADVPLLATSGPRFLLDAGGAPLLSLAGGAGAAWLAVGPEGGVETAERELLLSAGFVPASLGERVLRFETAGIVGLGVLHAARAAAGAADRPA